MYEELRSTPPLRRRSWCSRWLPAAGLFGTLCSGLLLGPMLAISHPIGQGAGISRAVEFPITDGDQPAGGLRRVDAHLSVPSGVPAPVTVSPIAYSAAPALSLLVTAAALVGVGTLVLLANGYANHDTRRGRPGRSR